MKKKAESRKLLLCFTTSEVLGGIFTTAEVQLNTQRGMFTKQVS